ncbi:MAG: hypothetical protein ACREBS_09670 [Nitrososphaerales archaeon]
MISSIEDQIDLELTTLTEEFDPPSSSTTTTTAKKKEDTIPTCNYDI